MTSADTNVVAYDYFAERLGVELKTVQIYAKANDPKLRVEGFPQPTITIGGVPYFDQEEADTFIDNRIEEGRGRKGRMNAHLRLDNSALKARVWRFSELTSSDLVGYDYFAAGLDVKVESVRDNIRTVDGFPQPADHVRGRGGHPSPRFRREDADAFITARNEQRGDRQRGRARKPLEQAAG